MWRLLGLGKQDTSSGSRNMAVVSMSVSESDSWHHRWLWPTPEWPVSPVPVYSAAAVSPTASLTSSLACISALRATSCASLTRATWLLCSTAISLQHFIEWQYQVMQPHPGPVHDCRHIEQSHFLTCQMPDQTRQPLGSWHYMKVLAGNCSGSTRG